MKKSFRAIMIEREKDYTYTVKACKDIFGDEILDGIEKSLLQHGFISVERGKFTPYQGFNKDFPAQPGTSTYELKVTLSQDVPCEAVLQNVSRYVGIWDGYLRVTREGEESSVASQEAPEISDKEAQKTAGENRLGDLMRELEAERKEREEKTTEKDVYESFIVDHRALEESFGGAHRRGFYLVEQSEPLKATITGPFRKLPINHEYVEGLAEDVKLVETTKRNDLVEYVAELRSNVVEDEGDFAQSQTTYTPWEVEVQDLDTGRNYTVIVRANSKLEARDAGVKMVADKNGLSQDNLIALRPDKE